ncbi:Rho-associated protein kinase 2 [Gurleya vavrai]
MKISSETLNLLLDCYNQSSFTNNIPAIKYTRDNLQNYTTLAPLAQGAYGDVFVVQHKNTKKIFALKRLVKERIKNQPHSSPFANERCCMIDCRSTKWLVSLHTSFQTPTHLYFLMDFYPGGDLLSLLSKLNVLQEKEIKFYAGEILLALEELHKLGYVHRDVKPDNVLITATGHIKLGDFGSCAKTIDGVIKSSVSIGTPDYISPEVLCSVNNEAVYSYEVDLWSFGVVVYEMINGYTPFYSRSLSDTYKKINNIEFINTNGSDEIKELINGLICEKSKRLGIEQIKNLGFFKDLNWNEKFPVSYVPDKNWNVNFITGEFEDLAGEDRKEIFDGFVGFSYDPNVLIEDSIERENDLKINEIENKKKDCSISDNKKTADKILMSGNNKCISCLKDKNQEFKDFVEHNRAKNLEEEAKKREKELIFKLENELKIYKSKAEIDKNVVKNNIFALNQNLQDHHVEFKSNINKQFDLKEGKTNLIDKNSDKFLKDKEPKSIQNEFTEIDQKKASYTNTLEKKGKNSSLANIEILKLKSKESMSRIKLYIDNIESQNEIIGYYCDHLLKQNNYLRKEARKKESKIDFDNIKCIDELKKELRQKKMETRELEQKINDENSSRLKLEDEIKYLRNVIKKNEKKIDIVKKEFICKKLLINKNEVKYSESLIKLENGIFFLKISKKILIIFL